MKKWMFHAQKILCAVAMFVAISSLDVMCQGLFYQPEEPAELARFKKA